MDPAQDDNNDDYRTSLFFFEKPAKLKISESASSCKICTNL